MLGTTEGVIRNGQPLATLATQDTEQKNKHWQHWPHKTQNKKTSTGNIGHTRHRTKKQALATLATQNTEQKKQALATLATQDTEQKNKTKQSTKHNTETSIEEQHGPHHKSGGEPRCSCRISQFLRIHPLCYSYANILWSLYIYFANDNGSSSFYIYFVFPLLLDCTMSNRCVLRTRGSQHNWTGLSVTDVF